jgi:hypothetical protein
LDPGVGIVGHLEKEEFEFGGRKLAIYEVV